MCPMVTKCLAPGVCMEVGVPSGKHAQVGQVDEYDLVVEVVPIP